jgi:uncharacterized protein (TIGR02444 family)
MANLRNDIIAETVMTMTKADHFPDRAGGAFWRFSLEAYGRPGVASACLDLQDRHGCDVNLVLFALWVGASGRGRLTEADIGAFDEATASWRRTVIAPLRALRRQVKQEADATALYEALKAAELEAEHAEQNRLEALAPPIAATMAGPIVDALANLAACLGSEAAFETAAPLRLALAEMVGAG